MAYLSGHRRVDTARRHNISEPGITVAARQGKELIKNFPEFAVLDDSTV
ncbi:MAG: hypothetical protein WCG31_02695 [Deltaproteobacteria bacterium]